MLDTKMGIEMLGTKVDLVGMEMLGREFDEETLIKLAYAYQEQFQPRVAPTFTPEL